MVYLSFVVQKIALPQDLYQLVVSHRMFIGLFSVLMSSILIVRFRWVAVWFVLIFELTKYYLFGNLFLAESLVAYLLVYMVGIAWLKFHQKELPSKIDLITVAVSTWMVAFLREPFIPLAGLMFLFIFFDKNHLKTKVLCIAGMMLSALWMISTVIFEDYFFNMFILNFGGYIQEELGSKGVAGIGALKIIFYPIYIFIGGLSTDFRIILLLLSCVFVISIGFLLIRKKYSLVIAIFAVLSLANIRFRDPGSEFYSGFHMLPWYALYIFITLFLVEYLRKATKLKWYMYIVGVMVIGVLLVAVKSPYSTIIRDVDRYEEFSTNYGRFYVNGEVINILSDADDKVFVDDWDTLVYWQTGLDSSYTYAMYFPVMNSVDKFSTEREKMFMKTPPEFYYTDCGQNKNRNPLPSQIQNQYINLYFDNEETCLYVLKSKAVTITAQQWEKINEFGFYIPENIL
jgi:hypothetical protein